MAVYDTALRGSAASVEAALRDGADFIIGPLLDTEVDEARMRAGFVPILALNIGTDASIPAPSFYRFSLSSDDEVEAIAARAIAAGHETAVILHSDADRGYTLRNAFRDAFEARGGRVINTAAYIPEAQAFDAPIKALLNISTSEARNTRLRANLQSLGLGLEFEPRRRADIDMIFLQAGPGNGRLLVPLLEQNLAEDLPTYATSEVYDPTRAGGDPDLDRLIFPELPLLVDPESAGRATELLESFSSDSTTRFRRMFAFGFDAYRVAAELYGRNAMTPGWHLAGASGELYLDSGGRVRRILPFAEFSGGRLRPAAPTQNLAGLR
jgi:outer membrane PBP1 activator LpoA protein